MMVLILFPHCFMWKLDPPKWMGGWGERGCIIFGVSMCFVMKCWWNFLSLLVFFKLFISYVFLWIGPTKLLYVAKCKIFLMTTSCWRYACMCVKGPTMWFWSTIVPLFINHRKGPCEVGAKHGPCIYGDSFISKLHSMF
jgi:hypothetical protein